MAKRRKRPAREAAKFKPVKLSGMMVIRAASLQTTPILKFTVDLESHGPPFIGAVHNLAEIFGAHRPVLVTFETVP